MYIYFQHPNKSVTSILQKAGNEMKSAKNTETENLSFIPATSNWLLNSLTSAAKMTPGFLWKIANLLLVGEELMS